MKSTVLNLVKFYEQHPECIGAIKVKSRFGYKTVEYADVTAKSSDVLEVTLENGMSVKTSPDHRLLNGSSEWIYVKNVKTGDILDTIEGPVSVKTVALMDYKDDLYDLQVADVHEFYANGITSHNSSLQESISFALFGKSLRGINKGQFINSINGKNCLVTIEFSTNGKQYKVVRGLKPNIFEIWVDSVLLNQESHARDYQEVLEKNILKMNAKSFGQIVVLGSASFVPFMQLSAWHRREFIEDLLDIGIFTKMNNVLKEHIASRKTVLTEIASKIDSVKKQTELQARHIEKMKSIAADESSTIQSEIDSLNSQLETIAKENSEDESILKEYDVASASAVITKMQTRLKKSTEIKGQLDGKIKEERATVGFYEKHSSCPTCSSVISDVLRNEKKTSSLKNISDITASLEELYKMTAETMTVIETHTETLKETADIRNRITTREASMRDLNDRIKRLYRRLSTPIASSDISQASDELRVMEESHIALLQQNATLNEEKLYDGLIYDMLKDTGIRTMIIKQYLPVMNRLINHYLNTLDFFVSFTLDENFNESIKSRHRDDFTYSSFSEGERMRIDLSLMFVWRQIAKMKNSSSTNLLILDEVLDGSVDTDGIDNLIKILDSLRSEANIYVISHRTDAFEGKFQRKLEFTKEKNFTVLTKTS